MATVNTDYPLITLTTDFGLEDNYVGVIKGVIAGLNPDVRMVDISHQVPPFNIDCGWYLIETGHSHFPVGSIHLAIIDPQVGSDRKAILIETADYFFIGPDNGLFSFLTRQEIRKTISITDKKYILGEISSTFHGRDIFAPVAGFLSQGIAPDEFGPEIKQIVRPDRQETKKSDGGLFGKVIYIDHFGNLVTSFRQNDLPESDIIVYLNARKIGQIQKTFDSVSPKNPVAYLNSFGYLEIGVNCGSAAEYFSVDYETGAKILIATP